MLSKLREQRAGVITSMRAMLDTATEENRELTEEEDRTYQSLEAQESALSGRIEREERLAEREQSLEQRTSDPIRPEVPEAGDEARGAVAPETGKVTEFRSFGEFMATVRFRPNDERLASLYAERESREADDLSMGTDATGGFAVPSRLLEGLRQVETQQGVIRPGAEVIPAGSPPDGEVRLNALDQTSSENMYGGVEVSWISEGETKPQTDMKIRQVTLQPHEVAAHVVVTDKLLRNWQASGPLVERQLRGAMDAAEDVEFFRGANAATRPTGIIGHASSIEINRDTANEISYADVVNMLARAKFGGTLVWVTNQAALPQLMQMRDPAGNLIWQPNARDGSQGTLLGRTVLLSERSPALGAKGDLALIDRAYYLIKDGSGPFVAASPHVHFVNNKTVIKAFWNVDGKPWLTAPIPTEGDTSVSPFVVLDVPDES